MADEADMANDKLERMLEGWRAEIEHHNKMTVAATGFCLNCDEPLEPFKRWCDHDCMTDWSKRNGR